METIEIISPRSRAVWASGNNPYTALLVLGASGHAGPFASAPGFGLGDAPVIPDVAESCPVESMTDKTPSKDTLPTLVRILAGVARGPDVGKERATSPDRVT